jgi:hypothetical protein
MDRSSGTRRGAGRAVRREDASDGPPSTKFVDLSPQSVCLSVVKMFQEFKVFHHWGGGFGFLDATRALAKLALSCNHEKEVSGMKRAV